MHFLKFAANFMLMKMNGMEPAGCAQDVFTGSLIDSHLLFASCGSIDRLDSGILLNLSEMLLAMDGNGLFLNFRNMSPLYISVLFCFFLWIWFACGTFCASCELRPKPAARSQRSVRWPGDSMT